MACCNPVIQIVINGLSLRKNSVQARALVGYLPENFVAPNEFYAHEYLRYRAGLKGIVRRERTAEVQRVMKLVALEDRSHQRFDACHVGAGRIEGVFIVQGNLSCSGGVVVGHDSVPSKFKNR